MSAIFRRPVHMAIVALALLPTVAHADAAAGRSIIILRNQHAELPAMGPGASIRASLVDAEQSAVASGLTRTSAVKRLRLLNAIAATLSSDEADALRARPDVLAVVPDLPLAPSRHDSRAGANLGSVKPASATPQQICPSDPAVPLLEPEALSLMNVPTTADGRGVKVAFLADGLDINNPDFIRADASHVFVDLQDFSGDGLSATTGGGQAFGDASSIAAQGRQVYDLSTVANPAHPLPPGCTIRVQGVAPGASLVGLKVFGTSNATLTSDFLQAIEYAVTAQVDVIDESFAHNPFPDPGTDPIALADAAAVAAGVTVVASTGDAGSTSTIGTPADAPGVIGVGATTAMQLYRQMTIGGSQLSAGGWTSNNISSISSGGFTQLGPHTVDVVAPGDLGWSICTPNTALFSDCTAFNGNPSPIRPFGGSEESAALTAGVAALVIQAYEATHNGVRPTPALVKQIIVSTATDLHVPAEEQGAGLVNATKAVQQAQSIADKNGVPTPQGAHLLLDHTSFSATATVGKRKSFRLHVTNTGAQSETLTPVLQALHPSFDSSDTGTLSLNPSTAPTFIDEAGNVVEFALHQFTVPQGAQRLDGSLTWNAAAQAGSIVRVTLFDPFGSLTVFSSPQGPGGFGHVDVHDPPPGTWTAVFSARLGNTSYNGDLSFAFTTQHFDTIGRASPSIVLKPGARRSVTAIVPIPSAAGDFGARLVLDTGSADAGSVPITVRALVPVKNSGGTFHGVLTGGNGRSIFGAQTVSFQFPVPPGRPVLNLAVQLADLNYNVTGFLIDPKNQPLDVQSTVPISGGGAFTNAMHFSVDAPDSGTWTFVLALNPPLTGQQLQEPFTGTIDFKAPPITTGGFPNSPATVLPAGTPLSAVVHVTNNGVSQRAYFVDPRLVQHALLPLGDFSTSTLAIPLPSGASLPTFVVPPHSDQVVFSGSASLAVQMTAAAHFGSPEIASSAGTAVTAQLSAPEVAPGFWFVSPSEIGPFGGPAPAGTFSASAVVDANQFDGAVTSDTGDIWLAAINPAITITPLFLDPGQSGDIHVTITPSAPSGTVVRGFVEVDTFNPNTISGDTLVAFPYAYRVQ